MNEAPTADGGPGFLAFLAFFLLALALWFLMRNMNARMRRMSYRQQAAHRGKDDPQAGPGELGARGDRRRPARPVRPVAAVAGDDPASAPVDESSGPGRRARRRARRRHRRARARPRVGDRRRRPRVTGRSDDRGAGERERGGDEVRREGQDGQRVEDLVEPEPAR